MPARKLVQLFVIAVVFLPTVIFSQSNFSPRYTFSISTGVSGIISPDRLKEVYSPSFLGNFQFEFSPSDIEALKFGLEANISNFSLNHDKLRDGEFGSSPLTLWGFSAFIKLQSNKIRAGNIQPFIKAGAGMHLASIPGGSLSSNYSENGIDKEGLLLTAGGGVNYIISPKSNFFLEGTGRYNQTVRKEYGIYNVAVGYGLNF